MEKKTPKQRTKAGAPKHKILLSEKDTANCPLPSSFLQKNKPIHLHPRISRMESPTYPDPRAHFSPFTVTTPSAGAYSTTPTPTPTPISTSSHFLFIFPYYSRSANLPADVPPNRGSDQQRARDPRDQRGPRYGAVGTSVGADDSKEAEAVGGWRDGDVRVGGLGTYISLFLQMIMEFFSL